MVCYTYIRKTDTAAMITKEEKIMNKAKTAKSLLLLAAFSSTLLLQGCSADKYSDGKIHITMLQYKPEAVKAFEKIEEKFNATHDNIHLDIESPNEAMTVLKTRLALLPIVIFYIICQKQIIGGVANGAVKG